LRKDSILSQEVAKAAVAQMQERILRFMQPT